MLTATVTKRHSNASTPRSFDADLEVAQSCIESEIKPRTPEPLGHKKAIALALGCFAFVVFARLDHGWVDSLFSSWTSYVTSPAAVESRKQQDAVIPTSDPCSGPPHRPMPTFKTRSQLGKILQNLNMKRGVELGVKQGHFAREMLNQWHACQEYLLVDLWAHQENYKDIANVDQEVQNSFFQETLTVTDPWKDKRRICRNYTSECVKTEPHEYYDFIYVDARHDYKGVYEDLVNWWPKLRPGGIFAGHDYITQESLKKGGQDWTINYDGTKDETGTVVKGAVDRFAEEVCRQVTVSYEDPAAPFVSWAFRK